MVLMDSISMAFMFYLWYHRNYYSGVFLDTKQFLYLIFRSHNQTRCKCLQAQSAVVTESGCASLGVDNDHKNWRHTFRTVTSTPKMVHCTICIWMVLTSNSYENENPAALKYLIVTGIVTELAARFLLAD